MLSMKVLDQQVDRLFNVSSVSSKGAGSFLRRFRDVDAEAGELAQPICDIVSPQTRLTCGK